MDRPIDRLRRLAEAGHAGRAPSVADLSWLADAAVRYFEEASLGLTMDDALALTSTGQNAWWRVEARDRRNAALVELYCHRFADIGINRGSREIVRVVQGAQKSVRPSTPRRPKEEVDPTTGLLIEAVMYSGAPLPAPKQIANILEINLPP